MTGTDGWIDRAEIELEDNVQPELSCAAALIAIAYGLRELVDLLAENLPLVAGERAEDPRTILDDIRDNTLGEVGPPETVTGP